LFPAIFIERDLLGARYDTIDEAIEIANSTDYGRIGLGPRPGRAGRGRSSDGGRDRLDQPALINPNVPFGGNKDSGFGVQYGAEGLKEYCYLRVISAKT
jgi:acyl-CoA reductase-like NAD-dependent aldehyde dehydrogenase